MTWHRILTLTRVGCYLSVSLTLKSMHWCAVSDFSRETAQNYLCHFEKKMIAVFSSVCVAKLTVQNQRNVSVFSS